ncbi:hypothetical protein QBD00_004265 [Ochrobactrum sp. AN78]|nr:hypothetical protein [Ochrobactrum sp. AN78]
MRPAAKRKRNRWSPIRIGRDNSRDKNHLSPKSADNYPGRPADCQQAVVPLLTAIMKQATLGGRSQDAAASVVEGTSMPGMSALITQAVGAGCSD